MDTQTKNTIVSELKKANNVLITVSTNPTVDELAAAIGLTIAMNKMDKHATTVFSGVVPSTIEFLHPEKTIETTTDSLRDFIIALDKSKADKLRYKVENDVVRIFITPYRTSLSSNDLEFTQGDFNVDAVVALGVTKKEDLDSAITAHGRILHDATVISVNSGDHTSDVGGINWHETTASSLCEMASVVISDIDPKVLDGQMATALLTGIIAETDRFKNEKTTPLALSLSSNLMQAGANQQLIAEKLDEPDHSGMPKSLHSESSEDSVVTDDGTLEISHEDPEIHIDETGQLSPKNDAVDETEPQQQTNDPVPALFDKPSEETADEKEPSSVPEQQEQAVPPPPPPSLPLPPAPSPSPDDGSVVPSVNAPVNTQPEETHEIGDPTAGEEPPTLMTPNSASVPHLSHEKVITPLSEKDKPKDEPKPFNLEEALKEAGAPAPVPQQQEQAIGQQTGEQPAPATQAAPNLPAPPPAAGESLSDLEKAVDSPHVQATPVGPVEEEKTAQSPPPADQMPQMPPPPPPAPEPVQQQPVITPPKPTTDVNQPPPVPPPMTAPQFFDANGNNSNPLQPPAN